VRDREFRFEFIVYTDDAAADAPGPAALLDFARDHVTWERLERSSHPELFQRPRFSPDPSSSLFAPFSSELAREIGDAIAYTDVAWSISCTRTWEDLTPLQTAMGVASAILLQQGGVAVLDRETGIAYWADDLVRRADQLDDEHDVALCDFVTVESTTVGSTLRMRTRGMRKFGHRDLVIEDVRPGQRDFGVWLLCALGTHSALTAPLALGRTLLSTRTGPAVRLFVQETLDDLLLVSDCHEEEGRPLPGVRRCIDGLYPVFLQRQQELTSDDTAEERRRGLAATPGSMIDGAIDSTLSGSLRAQL
jgi:hypothetical protein